MKRITPKTAQIPTGLEEKIAKATVPWMSWKKLPPLAIKQAWGTCRRGDKAHCINTNFVRAFAKEQGRTIRFPQTYKGSFHWSELIDGVWCQFVAPLGERYVRKIDGYDHDRQHFTPPVACPMGALQFVGICQERISTREEREERRERLNQRIADGVLVSGARFRELQTPYVEARKRINA